ncbi:MAG TPA: NAD(P)/FAD-dependent oxidoreductase [Dissulfurispiraceae bacterium]|nr:NAD(P)/FAD-dependent oxidoreductase [Dissulfurispiraceae bacterium]
MRTHALVIGGGPAGSIAATVLARHGVETVLLERDLSYAKPCGGGMPSTALEEFSIPQDVVTREIRKLRIVSPRGEEVAVELTGGHLCMTRRGVLDSRLRELAQQQGATVVEAEFLGFEERGREILSVLRMKATSETVRIRSNYVIAADGITGRVASLLTLPRPPCLYTLSAQMKHSPPPAELGRNGTESCEFWFGSVHASQTYSWLFPGDDGDSVGTGAADPKELARLFDTFIKRRYKQPVDNLVSTGMIGKKRLFKVPLWNGALFNIKNILFAGDAAGTVMPVTYEGIYYAMKSGEFAARAIIEGNPSLYRRLWNSRFKRRFFLMSRIRHHFFKDDDHIEKWVALHKKREVQEIAMRLWLRKELGSGGLISYIRCFRHLLS